ncbi:MAG: GDP-mannose 4,6-dehydratase [Vicinamibacterales bacterium]
MEAVVKPWENRRVFVTGATGLLGAWLCEELLARGAEVVCLVRDWVPGSHFARTDLLSRTTVVRGDLDDHPLLLRAMNEHEIDSVFHLGAQTIVGVASRNPLSTFEANVRGTWNLLEAARLCGPRIQRVVVASSDKAYGQQEILPYTEATPLQGRFPYDVSKSCADLIALSYFHTYGMPIAITRCGNLFGGGDLNFNRLVPGTIRSVLRGESPIIRSNGLYVREYFYVRDAVDAYLALAERLPEFAGHAFNFGSGETLTVLDMVSRILVAMDATSIQPTVLNQAVHEIPEQALDCSKAADVLGWTPKHRVDHGLRETVTWYRQLLTAQPPTSAGRTLDA